MTELDGELKRALQAIESPLCFASRNDFENLGRVKGLEKSLDHLIGRAEQVAGTSGFAKIVHRMRGILPRPQAPAKNREAQLGELLALVREALAGGMAAEHSPLPSHTDLPPGDPEPMQNSLHFESSKPPQRAPRRRDKALVGGMSGLELTQSIQFIKGVGPKVAARFEVRGISTVEDLLRFLPRRYADRR
jgi:ATP-dependent DNA helicase RecG